MSTPGTPVPALVAACVKWVDLRPEVDRVHGTVTPSEHGGGFSTRANRPLQTWSRSREAMRGFPGSLMAMRCSNFMAGC